jgi:uncharacterized membrane protein YsdA (DUF1294 family)
LLQTVAGQPSLLLWGWLALVNGIEFTVMGADKRLAVRKRRRVPEATLLLLALLGGSAGGVLGMLCFRHKTRHKLFAVGFPLILIIHVVLFVYMAFHY